MSATVTARESSKPRANNRVEALLDAAAVLFASQGYHRTTIRDITSAIGMGPGSSYYHFSSKAEMLLAVYEEGDPTGRGLVSTTRWPRRRRSSPWGRLEAALTGHIAAVLDPSAYARTIVAVLPERRARAQRRDHRTRDGYESQWRRPDRRPRRPVDAGLLRVFLLGAANSTQVWYRDGWRVADRDRPVHRRRTPPPHGGHHMNDIGTMPPDQPRSATPLRVLVTKIGFDGHDRGSRLVAAFLARRRPRGDLHPAVAADRRRRHPRDSRRTST